MCSSDGAKFDQTGKTLVRGAGEVSPCYNEMVANKRPERSKFLIHLITFSLGKHVVN